MGLEFQKDLLMASGEIRASQKSDLTKMQVKFCLQHFVYVQITPNLFTFKNLQERLIKKLGGNAFPFLFELPKNAPPSVTLQPGPEAQGKPCGVEYSLRIFVGESMDDRAHKRFTWI